MAWRPPVRLAFRSTCTRSGPPAAASPLTDETHGMVDRALLARMRPGSLLVNVARGELVDDDAYDPGLGRAAAPDRIAPDYKD